jgi:tellurite resistance protein TehA-like permease
MGTGVLAALANAYPYGNDDTILRTFFMFFFMLNLVLFLLVCGATLTRYIMFPTVLYTF